MNYAMLRSRAREQWRQLADLADPLIFIGMGTCGKAAGADAVFAKVTQVVKDINPSIRIIPVGCIGMCYKEPLMAVRKPGRPFIYYGDLTPQRAENILTRYIDRDDPCIPRALCTWGPERIEGITPFSELPMIRRQVRIALRNCGLIDPENIDHYIAQGGYSGLQKALNMPPAAVIDEIKAAGLRGRGGAGFPTGVKWGFAASAPGRAKFFICNADEGDPGAFMDRALLEGDPHAVLEGMLIGAYAIGAKKGYVYVRAEYPLAIHRLNIALRQMADCGLVGSRILDGDVDVGIEIKAGAGAFVCGEETALMASIEGSRGMPRPRPPFPARAGLWGMPTNINNVETLSNVSAIFARDAEWYAGYGTPKSRGTKTFSLAGNVKRTGLIEVPLGITLGDIIYDIGGGVPGGGRLKAVQTGGPSGGCIPTRLLHLPVDYEALAEAGAIMGSGGMVAMDENTCMVDMARYFLSFTHSESCGKCLPCRLGTGQLLALLEKICAGRGDSQDISRLKLLCEAVGKGSLCGLGQTAPNPVLTTLRYFPEEYEAHIHAKHCSAAVCAELFTAPCQHACPVGMDIPTFTALAGADRLAEAYDVMLAANPLPAVCGRVCHHPCQSRCRRGTLDEPVAVKNIKRYITDHTERPPATMPLRIFDESIAVVGAGPAGLSAAHDLMRRGYGVTIFEALPEPGGMMRYAIPQYRLPKDILAAEIDALLRTGIDFRGSTRVGEDIPWFLLLDTFAAVFLAAGVQKSLPMNIKGEELQGVSGAVEFLRQVNSGDPGFVGEQVAVIGGGNAAVDAARTVLRLGAETVHILYRRRRADMPAITEEIIAAEAEDIRLHPLTAPVEIRGAHGRVEGIVCRPMQLADFDSSGRRRPVPMEKPPFELRVDQVLTAIGQTAQLPPGIQHGGITVSPRGLISVRRGTSAVTGHPKVFAGGDVVTGPGTVIHALAAGKKAADEIDGYLRRQSGRSPYVAPLSKRIFVPAELNQIPENQPQTPMPQLSASHRCDGFFEVELGYGPKQAKAECFRCLRCDIRIEEESATIDAVAEEARR